MAVNLYSLAGQGGANSGYGVGSGVGSSLSTAGSLAMMSGGPLGMIGGGLALGAGTILNGIMSPMKRAAEEREGKARYAKASTNYQNKLAANPDKYSLNGISNVYSNARTSMDKSNRANTNSLLDRYSSTQQRMVKNKIQSGLTSGAAQANAVQNNIAFQQNANKLFQQQADASAQLGLREGQAKWQASDVIDARKDKLARSTLTGQGITDASALGGLTSKLTGGY